MTPHLPFFVAVKIGLAQIVLVVDILAKDVLRSLKGRTKQWQTPIFAIVHRRGNVGLACEYFATSHALTLLCHLRELFARFQSSASDARSHAPSAAVFAAVASAPARPLAALTVQSPQGAPSAAVINPLRPFDALDDLRVAVHGPLFARQIHRRDLFAVRVVGNGEFGQVYLAEQFVTPGTGDGGSDSWMRAVKMLHSSASADDRDAFLREAEIMLELTNTNIVRLIGVAVQQRPYLAVLEYVPFGDLLTVVKTCIRVTLQLTVLEDLVLLAQVASGMAHISAAGCIHMDLAARNCLLGAHNVVKIGDFGLAQKLARGESFFTLQKTMRLPIKWLAVECITDKRFSVKSDVWSFAVLCWEVLSYGGEPFSHVPPLDVVDHLCAGHRLRIPTGTPEPLCDLLGRCWRLDYDRRPSFAAITDEMRALVADVMTRHNKQVRDVGLTLENYKAGRRVHVQVEQSAPTPQLLPVHAATAATQPVVHPNSNPFLRASVALAVVPSPISSAARPDICGNPFLDASDTSAPPKQLVALRSRAVQKSIETADMHNNPFFGPASWAGDSFVSSPPSGGALSTTASNRLVPTTRVMAPGAVVDTSSCHGSHLLAVDMSTNEGHVGDDGHGNDGNDSDGSDGSASDDHVEVEYTDDADEAVLALALAQAAEEEAEYEAFMAEKAIADAQAEEEARVIAVAIAENRARQAALKAETDAKRQALVASEQAAREQLLAAQEASERAAASKLALDMAEAKTTAANLVLKLLLVQTEDARLKSMASADRLADVAAGEPQLLPPSQRTVAQPKGLRITPALPDVAGALTPPQPQQQQQSSTAGTPGRVQKRVLPTPPTTGRKNSGRPLAPNTPFTAPCVVIAPAVALVQACAAAASIIEHASDAPPHSPPPLPPVKDGQHSSSSSDEGV